MQDHLCYKPDEGKKYLHIECNCAWLHYLCTSFLVLHMSNFRNLYVKLIGAFLPDEPTLLGKDETWDDFWGEISRSVWFGKIHYFLIEVWWIIANKRHGVLSKRCYSLVSPMQLIIFKPRENNEFFRIIHGRNHTWEVITYSEVGAPKIFLTYCMQFESKYFDD